VKLDRDWYTGAEEGGIFGDAEHNPLSQYEDLNTLKQAEIATRQVVSPPTLLDMTLCGRSDIVSLRKKYPPAKHNM
jgi:hypothetical protein